MTRCSRCGRPLTNPSSIARGMGPVCAKRVGVRAMRKAARQEPPEASPIMGKPRVFISFHIDDQGPVELLRNQAKESETLEFTDYSVKEPFDEKWKTQCTERIQRSSLMLVAIGERTHEREAVLWEINKAYELNKPVFGMRIHSYQNDRIPQPMIDHDAEILEWKLEAIAAKLEEIKEQSQEQTQPERRRRQKDNYAYA